MSEDIIQKRISEIVQKTWEKRESISYLSTIGQILSDEELWPPSNSDESLLRFIERMMTSDVRVERHPDQPLVFGLLPQDAKLTKPLSDYFNKSTHKLGPPRFHPSFWAAFAKPVESGLKRYFDTRSLSFIDSEEDLSEEDVVLEIPPEAIPPTDAPERDGKIVRSIEEWCQDNGLEASQFIVSGKGKKANVSRTFGRITALDAFLDALDYKDIKELHIPLDIIDKLRRKKYRV